MANNCFELKNRNCWIVYLMPFGDKSNIKEITEFQESCISQKVFGMGWYSDKIEENSMPTDEIIKKYLAYQQKAKTALKNYKEIKTDDVVIVRNKNAHYYIGRVSEKTHYYSEENDDSKDKKLKGKISWMCKVNKWYDLGTDGSVPGDVVGRFSQRFHSTIQRVGEGSERLKILLLQLLENKETANYKFRKIHISNDTFALALNYMDLEDLVYQYIILENPGYILYPSSCKVNKMKYEFALVNPKNNKKITCQVKNDADISIEEYINDDFEKIYLFSALWDCEKVNKYTIEHKAYSHLVFISPDDLYNVLKGNEFLLSKLNNEVYVFSDIAHTFNDYTLTKRFNKNSKNVYKEWNKCLYFVKKSNMHYSKIFNIFIINDTFDSLTKEEQEFIKKHNLT